MALKLMYITNRPDVARIAESAGVDRIFVDMEYIGKAERQQGMDTVQSHHTVEDIYAVKDVLCRAELLVRVNPIHGDVEGCGSSGEEIDAAIQAGADILMLPYFKTAGEVEEFIRLVDGRCRTMPLLETPEAVAAVDEILALDGIDEIFVGLNDLSLGYGKNFMFELLADGTVETLCLKFRQKGISYGFGGIARLGQGMLPAEMIIKEHYRMGSGCVILSRSFCNVEQMDNIDEIRHIFTEGMQAVRAQEKECEGHSRYFFENVSGVKSIVGKIVQIAETRRKTGV
ncbi:aldolase/citrate lyase family protein [Acetatifactor muris]|uniref:aldolase/citrate lyase family protein n=1 Tax=Acetatifactor muris TaxID=879566 RepID=UPI0023F3E6E6|nr:aldolase/citrate lyase family protein [Acetatifactor muris]